VIEYEKSLNPSIMTRGTMKEKMLERVQENARRRKSMGQFYEK
jgi:hypothetical protein